MKRRPAVASFFYAGTRQSLLEEVRSCFLSPHGPGELPEKPKPHGDPTPVLISPHAGYVYSGPVAAHGYLELSKRRRPGTVIVVGPNHYGIGTDVSLYPGGYWSTPLGDIELDKELIGRLASASDVFSLDELSHEEEHSIEVQVPFVQFVFGEDVKFVPICMLDQSKEAALEVGRALAEAVKSPEEVAVIASSDFTHYEPHEEAKRRDMAVISRILELDIDGFYRTMREVGATLCGYGPIAAIIQYSKLKSYTKSRLLKYASSGDTGGDKSSVVGYASIAFDR
ncbi:MAG: AmmeMemoRadiSam system protein B [Thaumarchaeota archaeon]|nr:AmmeMemoRadiSam system protein B [Candidatus Calditenuaceae archaeon]MDW8041744.1 AmmeMemoRadiSam system protein B [Nitrososphaerota archaeon]